MSVYIDHIKNEKKLPITYSINIKALSASKRPLTCYINTTPRLTNPFNYLKTSKSLEKLTENNAKSSIHLPVTYSTSIHVPYHPTPLTQPTSQNQSSQSSHHHYHHYHHHHHHHYYHHHQRQPSTSIKNKISPRPTSITSTQPTTTTRTATTTITTPTITSPEPSSSSPPTSNKKLLDQTPSKSPTPTKQSSPQPPLPSYSALVWNWFHHTPTKPKTKTHHKGSQSDYSEICRHDSPSKRSLLFKLLTSPNEKQTKSKHHPTCFTRKRFESSSSLPNKYNHYNE